MSDHPRPEPRYLPADLVLSEMAAFGHGPGWASEIGWNIIPVGFGNIVVGARLVALPFWYAFRKRDG